MDNFQPFKQGYLLSPPQSRLLKRTWQRKYYALYQASNLGIERVEVFENEDQFQRHTSGKLIPLNDCIKVVQTPQKHQHNVFEVICKNQTYQFSAETTQQLAEWIAAFQTVAFGSQRRESYPLSVPPLAPPAPPTDDDSDCQQEENSIYSSMNGPEVYRVEIIDTEPAKRCHLQGFYELVVTPVQIALRCPETLKIFYTWPYRHIRRFIREKGIFSFEAGRNCTSGEGLIQFKTKEWNAIYSTVGARVKSYRRNFDPMSNATSTTNLSTISSLSSRNYTGSDLNVAAPASTKIVTTNSAASTAGSATGKSACPPLPPTPDSENIYENTALGHTKFRPPIAKPPRKNKSPSVSSITDVAPSHVSDNVTTFTGESSQSQVGDDCQTSTTVIPSSIKSESVYDEPEDRKEAWKTHGSEFPIHTENVQLVNNDGKSGPMYASVDVTTTVPTSPTPRAYARNLSIPELPINHQISVIQNRTRNSDSGSYDRLFQFNTHQTPRSATNPDHIYKRLVKNQTSPQQSAVNEINSLDSQYASVRDEYKSPQVQSPEYANPVDSMLKQADESSTQVQHATIHHIVQNDEVYSVIIKPNKTTSSN